MERKPLISPQLVAAAAGLGAVLSALGVVLVGNVLVPGWLPLTVYAVGTFSLWLAGKQAPPFTVLGPSVPKWLVPTLGAAGISLAGFAASLPAGTAQSALLVVASLIGYASGKAAPPDSVAMSSPTLLRP